MQANLNYYKLKVTLTVKTLRWADGMLKEPRKTFMASYQNISFIVRVERVKGFHYRSLSFKNIIKSTKEHTNKNNPRLFKNILAVVLNRCTRRQIRKIVESNGKKSRIKLLEIKICFKNQK